MLDKNKPQIDEIKRVFNNRKKSLEDSYNTVIKAIECLHKKGFGTEYLSNLEQVRDKTTKQYEFLEEIRDLIIQIAQDRANLEQELTRANYELKLAQKQVENLQKKQVEKANKLEKDLTATDFKDMYEHNLKEFLESISKQFKNEILAQVKQEASTTSFKIKGLEQRVNLLEMRNQPIGPFNPPQPTWVGPYVSPFQDNNKIYCKSGDINDSKFANTAFGGTVTFRGDNYSPSKTA